MRHSALATVLLFASGVSFYACDDNTPLPTVPPAFKKGGVPAPQARINQLIKQVFPQNPAKSAAQEQFSDIKDNLAAGYVEIAQALTLQLIDMVRTGTGPLEPEAALINELLNFSGIGGVAGIIGADGGDLVAPDFRAAVSFPPGALTGDEVISFHPKAHPCFPVSAIPADQQFDFCYAYEPHMAFETDVRVEVCLNLPESDVNHDAVQLHSREDGGQPVPLESVEHQLVDCGSEVASTGSSPLRQMVRSSVNRILRFFTPEPLTASVAVLHIGLGGLKGSFSDFGWAVPQEKPDLTVASLELGGPSQAVPFTITVTVDNIGTGNAGAFVVEVQLVQGTDVFVIENAVAGLAAGASVAVPFEVPACSITASFLQVHVTVDKNLDVAEQDEDNNTEDAFTGVTAGEC